MNGVCLHFYFSGRPDEIGVLYRIQMYLLLSLSKLCLQASLCCAQHIYFLNMPPCVIKASILGDLKYNDVNGPLCNKDEDVPEGLQFTKQRLRQAPTGVMVMGRISSLLQDGQRKGGGGNTSNKAFT